ncbi:AAA family ATPase [Methylopila henanensis]
MRFERLTLERYGAIETREIAFSGHGLTVIYGPNEAGKSTALSAVGDVLFGVPARSVRGAVFGNDAMRLGAEITRADGSSLSVRRRKGKAGRTLTGEDGAALDEAALAALLGATTRERFEALFGLDHERLRDGGESLFKADGEIGRLIVEAGGGLRALVARLERIDQERDRLFGARKSDQRAFYRALDAFDAADGQVKAGLLTREAYERAKAAHAEAAAACERLRSERRAAVVAVSALERLGRVAPPLQRLDRIEAEAESFADLAELPPAFDREVGEAFAAAAETGRALEEAEAAVAAAEARLRGVTADPALLAQEAAIRDIGVAAVHVAEAREHRANRQVELAQAQAKLARLRRRLGVAPDADLAARLPPPEAIEAGRRLAAAAQTRAPSIVAEDARIRELAARLAALDQRIAEADARGHDRPAGVTAAEFAGLPAADAAARALGAEADDAAVQAQERLEALGFADFVALAALRAPDRDTLAALQARDDAAEAERLGCLGQRDDARGRREAAEIEISRLTSGGEIATDQALGEARRARGAAWSAIRPAYVTGRSDDDEAARTLRAAHLERAVAEADELADRRAAEAGRAAALAEAERRRDEARIQFEASERALVEIAGTRAEALEALARDFPEAYARAAGLPALRAFAEERRAVLDLGEAATRRRREAEAARTALSTAHAALAFAERLGGLSSADASAALTDRVRAAQGALARHEEAHVERRRDARDRDEARASLDAARARRAALGEEAELWRQAWEPAVARLGLTADATPDDGADAAVEWAEARGVMDSLELIRRRLRRMDEDEQALGVAVAAAGDGIGLALPQDAVAAARMLQERFAENDARRRERETLTPHLQDATAAVERRRAGKAAAEDRVAALAALAGVQSPEELAAVAARHAERRTHQDEARRLRDTIDAAGDGLSLDALRAEAEGRDPDGLRADREAASARAEAIERELDAAARAEHEAETALAACSDPAGVNRAVALREAAIAELHESAERYVELSLARDLVEAAIARVRAERQDPLIARAGALFALATRGAFSGVAADVDADGQPVVVGVRAGGGAVPAKAMSDGTRDQLFLAFRLASIENYNASTEPLPFVADDILVHFDDARSRAALELLAASPRDAQALLFTHHRSVLRMAEELAAEGRCGIATLG